MAHQADNTKQIKVSFSVFHSNIADFSRVAAIIGIKSTGGYGSHCLFTGTQYQWDIFAVWLDSALADPDCYHPAEVYSLIRSKIFTTGDKAKAAAKRESKELFMKLVNPKL